MGTAVGRAGVYADAVHDMVVILRERFCAVARIGAAVVGRQGPVTPSAAAKCGHTC
jgi:hypothetical protein